MAFLYKTQEKNKNNNNNNSSYIKDTHLKVYQKPGTKSMMTIFKFLLVYTK